ncbi:MAG: hypothetical protein JNL97_01235 [Verrucomicrobiales bacterium]|nr:hypothetical protein [Verrucomicrobiales bacterium]
MRLAPIRLAALGLCVSVLVSGCGKESLPPQVSTAQVVAGAPEMFKGAPADVQKLAAEAAEAIGKQDYPTAWDRLQTLNATPNLTDAQKEFVASSVAAVGAEMNKAEETGNEAAQEALRIHRANK